jgi:C_GCAxxG_C_C family probable redox protein
MDDAYTIGFRYEAQYHGCAQCSFAALQEVLGRRDAESDAVFRSAAGLAGGVGGEGDGHCGAYSGAVMMIGCLLGRTRDDFEDRIGANRRVRGIARRLHERFVAEYGTVTCHGIHRKIFGRPFYLKDPEESAKFDAAGAHTEKCPAVVGRAARWTVEILESEGFV